ncbi:hypothetical protein OSJ77_15085 [Phyllobacterium sp. 0TCS1.6C]|uniref:hypothetical protein n=1 Tax=unclassified Phyllobacterium TaxID=2638441 RepID=UPI0022645596|nr:MULTISPECIES: hypothetical protein [unclassified Phyllobacterium]MCX8281521.1 hypothetical protein [Phyllobacterium sp. 0TCS1.6C]MCX8292883.1 hypothetical protein [Phyllobacterium sp. 0TCS1.6A]
MSSEDSPVDTITIDKVRASKAGHAYHEAWAARTALELLLPSTDLTSITLEGFDERDEQELGIGAVEIADLVRYHGGTDVAGSHRVTVVQFKYSIASAKSAVRAADLASTLVKFAITDAELRVAHGDEHVEKAVRYEFSTNRPIHDNLGSAITAVIAGSDVDGDVGRQAGQIAHALEDYPHEPAELLRRLELVGSKGSLVDAERLISATLAAWSEPSDPDAEKRLLKLRNLIRIKAGPGSEADKRVDRVAVLAELEVEHEDRLYPTPDAFPEVQDVVQRAVLADVLAQARQPGAPLILHAAGGMGKTVLMQGLADQLRADGPVVLFDGFGAGRWRDPADGRHLPDRTLVHLANLLAGEGLCDILLPIADATSLLRAFRRRLVQSVATARNTNPEACLSLVLDAIDHAGLAAQATATPSFAHLLLRSVSVDPIEGVRLIASCRTERLAIAIGDSTNRGFPIPSFTDVEARTLIARRVPDASGDEVAALLTRSGRNPRCLDSLITTGRPFDPLLSPDATSEPNDLLDALLRKRLAEARDTAHARGAQDADIDLLLAGIALLTPPVPIEELAAAHGLIAEEVESFAADLAPLLERTPHGLMFRDEPTETLVRSTYGTDQASRDRVISALQNRQLTSNYAARALPALLTSLRDADQLIRLAYDLRVPDGASQVSTRDIRLARVTAAMALAGELGRRDDLLKLLLEASFVAAGHERSDRFLYEHPDLAAVANDPEALRRLALTNVGWPGGKHSALALANAFAGDRDEARRHARRSIDWHNWAAQSRRGNWFNTSNVSRDRDDVGFAYVEMLAGNDVRVAEFFGRREDGTAFVKFSELFDLLERHETTSHAPSARVVSRLCGCRLPLRSLFAAAMRFTERDDTRDKRVLRAMAAAPPVTAEGEGLAMASVLAAARAADLGLYKEGMSLVEGAGLKAQSIFHYSSYNTLDRTIDLTVAAAGVRSALRGKPVTLIDIAPSELIKLVPKSARTRGAAAFSRALTQKLAEPKYDGARPQRKRRGGLDDKDRSDYSRTLSSRITPLLQYAQDIASIVRPPSGRTRIEMVSTAFDRLIGDVERSSNYPYRDGKAYLARTGFRAIFYVSDALGALDPALAKRMVDWLASAPGLFAQELTDAVARLSRVKECQDAALTLAGHVERKIQLDTDVGSRVTAYGRLSRAVWRVSTEEASAYFRRALDLAEAIGSDDFDRTNHLLELTGHYSGPELSAVAAHTLARILELNQGEDGRFPWIEYAQTMVPIAGLGVLAMLARLDDRDVARLNLSLGPTLTVLMRQSKLPAATAAALFGLAAPGEAWTWRISDFASEAIKHLPKDHLEWFFNLLLVEIDRDDQLTPARETIEGLQRLAQQTLPATSKSRARIEGLLTWRGPLSETPPSPVTSAASPEPPPIFPIDLSDPDEIDRQISSEEVDQTGRRWPVRTLLELAKRTSTPAERLGFVRAVVESNIATLADKVSALDNYVEEWSKISTAMRDALPRLGLRLASKHAAELAGSSSDAWGAWRGLEKYFLADRIGLVEHVVAGLRGVADELGGNAWLALAARLAAGVSNQAIAEGLDRFLASSAEKLPTEVGDGPWDDRLLIPEDEADLVAALLWARLGHPVAAMRWRAAHAIRRLAEIRRFDILDQLIARFSSKTALPFTDAKLPFYAMHAQLWLLIALARVSKDNPNRLLCHRSFFEGVALSLKFPHVVMRSFAIDILRNIAPALAPTESAASIDALSASNVSPYANKPRAGYAEFRYVPRPDSSPQPADAFHLDYDFNKYQVDRLCDVFACPSWEVEDRIGGWVRRWDKTVSAMHECPRESSYGDTWSSGYVPGRDLYGGYLGWHALMLAAGDLLASRPVVGDDWRGDAWADFLNEYQLSRDDGLWLADLTDQFPLDLVKELDIPMPESGESRSTIRDDARLLAPMLGINNGKLAAEWTPVAGRWSINRDTNITIRSVLASDSDARSTAMTLLSDEAFFRWLPDDEDEITRHFGKDDHSVQPWVAETPNTQRQLDRHDPYGSPSALDRPFPTDVVREVLGVTPSDVVVRRWSIDTAPGFYAEAWGAEGGRGEHTWSEMGSRIFTSTCALESLLEATNRNLVILVKLQKYHRGKSSGRIGDTSAFTHRSLIVVSNKRGQVWLPQRLSSKAKIALDTLNVDRRRDFYARFRAIAGLPDEWLARRNTPPVDPERVRKLIEGLADDKASPQ